MQRQARSGEESSGAVKHGLARRVGVRCCEETSGMLGPARLGEARGAMDLRGRAGQASKGKVDRGQVVRGRRGLGALGMNRNVQVRSGTAGLVCAGRFRLVGVRRGWAAVARASMRRQGQFRWSEAGRGDDWIVEAGIEWNRQRWRAKIRLVLSRQAGPVAQGQRKAMRVGDCRGRHDQACGGEDSLGWSSCGSKGLSGLGVVSNVVFSAG